MNRVLNRMTGRQEGNGQRALSSAAQPGKNRSINLKVIYRGAVLRGPQIEPKWFDNYDVCTRLPQAGARKLGYTAFFMPPASAIRSLQFHRDLHLLLSHLKMPDIGTVENGSQVQARQVEDSTCARNLHPKNHDINTMRG